MIYRVLSQKKIEDTKFGERFEIIVRGKDNGIYRSTYLFKMASSGYSSWVSHEDATLELLAKMTPEEIFREVFSFLEREGFDTSRPVA